jgi:hypothetical protein
MVSYRQLMRQFRKRFQSRKLRNFYPEIEGRQFPKLRIFIFFIVPPFPAFASRPPPERDGSDKRSIRGGKKIITAKKASEFTAILLQLAA